jgi:hypothetical protein
VRRGQRYDRGVRRAAIIASIVLVASVSSAKRVIRLPSVIDKCSSAASWSKLETCVGQFGKPTVVAELNDARLVQLPDASPGDRAAGLYLYTRGDRDSWVLRGTVEGPGNSARALQPVTLGRRSLYRIDVRSGMPIYVDVGGVSRVAVLRQSSALFCGAQGAYCVRALLACDVYVDGHALHTFRGTLTWDKERGHLTGDRSLAGDECASAEDIALPYDSADLR